MTHRLPIRDGRWRPLPRKRGRVKSGQEIERKSLTAEVLRWLSEPSGTFLALLGDFGCGKTSFSKRLACELAQAKSGTRVPVLIDLREGGSTTVTLENLLTHCFQRLSPQPFNPQAFLQLNREGYLVLIFDGFDETIAYTEPGRYVDNLRQILRAAEGKAKVLMTCRTHYFRDRPEALRHLGKAPAVTVAWSPDGTRLASGSYDQAVRIWDTVSGKELRVLAFPAPVLSLSWSSDGRRLVIAFGGFLEIWDIEADPPRPLVRLYSAPGGGSGVAATPDGYVFGPPEALEWVRFGYGWALYDVTDVPERVSEERVLTALRPKGR